MASFCIPCPKCSPPFTSTLVPEAAKGIPKHSMVFFNHGSDSNASLMSRSSLCMWPKKQSSTWKVQAQLNDVASKKSSNIAPVLEPKSSETKDLPAEVLGQKTIADVPSISAFMTQVSDLVKLVDSRDIVELELKQLDCEILIRKKEAMPQPPPAAPIYHTQPAMYQSQPPPAQALAPPLAAPAPSALVAALPPPKAAASLHPPLKCPMAGTFYRSSGPGEPPFIKVGDKVQKGQVICIIEAMKLMNEIEADQSGTVVEVLAEDAKPVSVDTPLFILAP